MRWAARKNDSYTNKAKKEGYPARSVYKLKEIDVRYKLFKEGDRVLDLGCAPGSWMMYIAERIGPKGKVVGIDVQDIKTLLKSNMLFLKTDVENVDFSSGYLQGKYEAVVSDMAPKTQGIKFRDAGESLFLSQKALEIAKLTLKPGGNFLCKVFEGEESQRFFKEIAKNFDFIKYFRPKAVRRGSREFYIIAKDFHY